MGVGADAVYRINKYYIYTQDWYWPLRKRITKKLRKEKMYKENIIKNLDVIVDHMQYKQSSEFSETHREESEISEFTKAYKTLQLHSSKNWVTSPSVKMFFMDSQSLSQSPK